MASRSLLNWASVSFLHVLVGMMVAGCGNTWAFRVRERPDAPGQRPHSLALRCKDQPVRFAVRSDGYVRSFGPVKLTCDSSNPTGSCSPTEACSASYAVKAGAWLMVEAAEAPFTEGAILANGALCWVEKMDSAECSNEEHLMDVYIECPKP